MYVLLLPTWSTLAFIDHKRLKQNFFGLDTHRAQRTISPHFSRVASWEEEGETPAIRVVSAPDRIPSGPGHPTVLAADRTTTAKIRRFLLRQQAAINI
jgi:hypothetical protein